MIKLRIITLGKLKEKYLKDAEAEYLKRLSAYAKCELIELEPVKTGDNPSSAEIEKAVNDRLEKALEDIHGHLSVQDTKLSLILNMLEDRNDSRGNL